VDRVKERLAIARRAGGTLTELLDEKTPSKVVRDAAIQRFENSFEAIWKAAQLYIRIMEGIEIASPKGGIRTSSRSGFWMRQKLVWP